MHKHDNDAVMEQQPTMYQAPQLQRFSCGFGVYCSALYTLDLKCTQSICWSGDTDFESISEGSVVEASLDFFRLAQQAMAGGLELLLSSFQRPSLVHSCPDCAKDPTLTPNSLPSLGS